MVFTLRREESQRLCRVPWDLLISADFAWKDFRYHAINSIYANYCGLEHLLFSRFRSLILLSTCIIKRLLWIFWVLSGFIVVF